MLATHNLHLSLQELAKVVLIERIIPPFQKRDGTEVLLETGTACIDWFLS